MNEMEAKDEIRLIQEMIERTKKITAGSWMFFLVWGIVIILGIAGMYALVFIEKFSWIWQKGPRPIHTLPRPMSVLPVEWLLCSWVSYSLFLSCTHGD